MRFGELVRRYPDSRYAADARLKLDLVNDHLAGKEMEIGRFYERRGQVARGELRFRERGRQVPDHAATRPKRSSGWSKSYLALGIPAEA